MHSATTWCVSYPQLHSSRSSFYGITSLFFFHKYMSATTIMVWSVFPKFQSRKLWFLCSGSFPMGMWQMEGRRCLPMSLILAHWHTQKNKVETFFWTSFVPGIWSTGAWSSHITKGKASYSVMVFWVAKSEMAHQKCTQKCTMPEPREIKTLWNTLDTHTLHNRPLSKPHNKG